MFTGNAIPFAALETAALTGGADWLRLTVGLDSAASTAGNVGLILVGMLLIAKGGDVFTDSAVSIARASRVPPVIVGATIVSIATTFPEFMVSLSGALAGQPDFAVGNALGSCCCNIGLIVGTCALLKGFLAARRGEQPGIPVSRQTLLGPGLFMMTAGISVWMFSMFGNSLPGVEYSLSRWQGGVLFALLAAYLGYSLRTALQARFESGLSHDEQAAEDELREHILKPIAGFLLGALFVVLGSRLLVANAERLALIMGVSKLVIGLTVLAIGTSLPEYTISLIAVIKGHGSLGIGNIIGANVLNITWVVSTCALISPLPIQKQTVLLDAPVVLLLMTLLLVLAWQRERISVRSGAILFGVFCTYLAVIFTL